jgi:hypothetical protein
MARAGSCVDDPHLVASQGLPRTAGSRVLLLVRAVQCSAADTPPKAATQDAQWSVAFGRGGPERVGSVAAAHALLAEVERSCNTWALAALHMQQVGAPMQ